MLHCEYLLHFGHLAPDEAFDGVDEVELRERASLAGSQHLDADGAVLLVAGYYPGVSPVGTQRWPDLVVTPRRAAEATPFTRSRAKFLRRRPLDPKCVGAGERTRKAKLTMRVSGSRRSRGTVGSESGASRSLLSRPS